MKKLLFFYKVLMSTFWFVPVLIIMLSVIFAIGLVTLDNFLDIPKEGWFRFFLVSNSDSARSILSTISGAMIGVAGTVFSVTLVALTLASSQFGPRLIKNFMHIRLNQIVLGSYVATYLYCLLVLNIIKGGEDNVFIPTLSVLVAILVAIVNIVLLIFFIHNIAVSIQADKVVADISVFMAGQVKTLFPENMGEQIDHVEYDEVSTLISNYQVHTSIVCTKTGYLQYIDSEALMDHIEENDGLLELYHRAGNYLIEGLEIGVLHSKTTWEKDKLEVILNQLVIGQTKTSQQDLEFSIYQLVEIAARALSPGINDPFTAISCIDNLTSSMSYLAQIKFPSKYRYDEDRNLRIIANAIDFEGVMDASFNQIRQFSGGNTAVLIRLMEALIIIQKFIKNDNHKLVVLKHAKMVLNKGKESITEENDLQDLIERANKILK